MVADPQLTTSVSSKTSRQGCNLFFDANTTANNNDEQIASV